MKRRAVIKQFGTISLLAGFPQTVSFFLSSCKQNESGNRAGFFSDRQYGVLETLCDIILPATSTPAASEVQTAYFVELVTRDCLEKKDQQLIRDGLDSLLDQDNKSFSSGSDSEKEKAVRELDQSAYSETSGSSWFRMVKRLACIGYFTSQEVSKKGFRYAMDPGEYLGCIPYKKGDKAMAKTYLMYY